MNIIKALCLLLFPIVVNHDPCFTRFEFHNCFWIFIASIIHSAGFKVEVMFNYSEP